MRAVRKILYCSNLFLYGFNGHIDFLPAQPVMVRVTCLSISMTLLNAIAVHPALIIEFVPKKPWNFYEAYEKFALWKCLGVQIVWLGLQIFCFPTPSTCTPCLTGDHLIAASDIYTRLTFVSLQGAINSPAPVNEKEHFIPET